MQKFWLVWNGKESPTRRHDSLEAARKEAERLVTKNPSAVFIVLEAVAQCSLGNVPVRWEELN